MNWKNWLKSKNVKFNILNIYSNLNQGFVGVLSLYHYTAVLKTFEFF